MHEGMREQIVRKSLMVWNCLPAVIRADICDDAALGVMDARAIAQLMSELIFTSHQPAPRLPAYKTNT